MATLTTDEQAELDALELAELEAEEAGVVQAPAPVAAPKPSMWNSDIPVMLPSGGFTPFTINPSKVAQTVKNLGLEGGGATLGQIVGAPFEAVGGMHIGGAIGGAGGNALAQMTTPGKKFSLGEVAAAAAAGTIPGASLAKAGTSLVVKQGAKYAGSNLVGKALETGIDEKRLPTLGESAIAVGAGAAGAGLSRYLDQGARAGAAAVAKSQDSLRRETLKAGRELGLGVPPAVTAPGPINNTLQSLGGKAAVAQEQILRNQPKVNSAVRAEIGLPESAPITPIALNTARVAPNMVYDEVAKLTPATGALLDQFKNATAEANRIRQAYRASIDSGRRNPTLLAEAEAQDAVAEQMLSGLKAEATTVANGLKVMERFNEARVKLAQIGLAERAVNKGSGDIDAKIIGDALEQGEKLTGNFAKIGKFQNAFGKYIQDAANVPPSGVDYLKLLGKFGVGTGVGYAMGGYPGAFIGGVGTQIAEKGARNLAVNPAYQRAFAKPFYGAATEDIPASIARLATQAAGRDDPLTEEEQKKLDELRARFAESQ